MVHTWAIDTGFILGFLAGLIVLVWTLAWPPVDSSGSGKIKLGNWEFQFTGRAIFQLFIAVLLIAFPVLLSAAARTSSTAPTPLSYEKVSKIPEPSYAAFRFLRDTSILDLRGASRGALLSHLPLIGKKSNPVNLTDTMAIRKVNATDVISFTYGTSGTLDIRCLNRNCKLRTATEKDEHSSGELKQTWDATSDVSDVPVGDEFEIIVEATYWNAFDTPQKQWYATYANEQTEPETVATLLLFPTDKPFGEYSLLAYPHGSTQGKLLSATSKIVSASDKLSLYWEIPNAQGIQTYEIHWKY